MVGKMALQCGHAKSGVSGGQPSSLAAKGQINSSRMGGKGKQAEGRLGESLPEGHKTIGFHQGTAEADRIQGGQNARKAGSGGDGAQGRALQHDARTRGMAEWQKCRALQAGKPTDAPGECCRSAAISALMARR